MDRYKPPYEITDMMSTFISDISEKVGRMDASGKSVTMPHLRRNTQIRSIYSSLRIEANSLTADQVRDVIDGKSVMGPASEILEVKNAYEAYSQIGLIDPYQISELLRLHGVMTKGLIAESGTYRHGEEGVFNGKQCIFMAPPARLVPSLMEDLLSWMGENKSRMHPLILSSVFHYEFVFIHPFADGNGRMARLWQTLLLAQWKPIFAHLSVESQIERYQDDYYKAIADCHAAGSSNVFIEFMLERISEALDAFSIQAASETIDSPYVARLLACMAFGASYSAAELLTLLGLRSRQTLRMHYLDPAIQEGLVEMTIPEKPSSRNQRYRRTEP